MIATVLASVIASGHPQRMGMGRDPGQGGQVGAHVERTDGRPERGREAHPLGRRRCLGARLRATRGGRRRWGVLVDLERRVGGGGTVAASRLGALGPLGAGHGLSWVGVGMVLRIVVQARSVRDNRECRRACYKDAPAATRPSRREVTDGSCPARGVDRAHRRRDGRHARGWRRRASDRRGPGLAALHARGLGGPDRRCLRVGRVRRAGQPGRAGDRPPGPRGRLCDLDRLDA